MKKTSRQMWDKLLGRSEMRTWLYQFEKSITEKFSEK